MDKNRIELQSQLIKFNHSKIHLKSVLPAMMLAIQLSLKSMESLQNALQPYSGANLFVSIVFNETNRSIDSTLKQKVGVNGTLIELSAKDEH